MGGVSIASGGKVLTVGGGGVVRAVASGGGGDPSNTLTITDVDSTTTTNYPVQFGRPFAEGEIADYPQALIGGTPVTTQANVQTRWPGGSVKHAIVSFLVPSLTADSTITITFQNQASGNTTGYLDKTGMLVSGYDFNATIALTNGSTVTATARTMLNADAFTYWLQGSVCTSVIIADHSSARAYDMGFDANESFRPIFQATFWPTINKVFVRCIGEICNTEALQDQVYSLAITTGDASPASVYTKTSFTHCANSRWTKAFWIGGTPADVQINHNLSYLVTTNHIPNHDTTKVVPEATLATQSAAWTGASTDITGAGNWAKSMGAGGGRPDIGIMPAWCVRWLYSGDNRLRDQAIGNAYLSGAWPLHFREGTTGKYFDSADTISGMGKIVSVRNRASVALFRLAFADTTVGDKITPVGTMTTGGWDIDTELEHYPDPSYIPYLLTGDFWFLEQMWFWAGFAIGAEVPAWRGPTGAECSVSGDSTRGMAWRFRSVYHAAVITPDALDEATYFREAVDESLATWEGQYNITTGDFYNNTQWTWARASSILGGRLTSAGGIPPLFQLNAGASLYAQAGYGMDTSTVGYATGGFMDNYFFVSMGICARLGFSSQAILTYCSQHWIQRLVTPGFDPYLISIGRFPVRNLAGTYFATWADADAAILGTFTNGDEGTVTRLEHHEWMLADGENGYGFIAMAGLSMVTAQTDGADAWTWVLANIANDPSDVLNANPKWALVP